MLMRLFVVALLSIGALHSHSRASYSSLLWATYCEGLDLLCSNHPTLYLPNVEDEGELLQQNWRVYSGFKIGASTPVSNSTQISYQYTHLPFSSTLHLCDDLPYTLPVTSSMWEHLFRRVDITLITQLPLPLQYIEISTECGFVLSTLDQSLQIDHLNYSDHSKVIWNQSESLRAFGPYGGVHLVIPASHLSLFLHLAASPMIAESNITFVQSLFSIQETDLSLSQAAYSLFLIDLTELSLGISTLFSLGDSNISLSFSYDCQLMPRANTLFLLSGEEQIFGNHFIGGLTSTLTLTF